MSIRSLHLRAALLLVLIVLSSGVHGVGVQRTLGHHELYAEFTNPYYAAAGVYLALSDNGIPVLDSTDEGYIYRHLITRVHRANVALLEVGAYPLPLAGAGVKAWGREYYERAAIGEVNLVQAITSSSEFAEPWSVSAFLGHVVSFVGADSAFEGRGHVGLLCSYGNRHIKDNSLHPDHWLECELKLKLDKGGKRRRYATSYRLGARLHSNSEVRDLAYVGLRRQRTDFSEPAFSLIRNTNFQLRADMALAPAEFLRLIAEVGKKFPLRLRKRKLALGLSLGLVWQANNPYRGNLGRGFEPNSISPIIKPLIQF